MAGQPIVDSGWAWIVVVGGFINNLLSMGFYRSGGIIYISSTTTFTTTRSVASWIPMVTLTIVFMMAPVGTLLCKKFSYSSVTFVGGILASVGMLICFLATRVEFMFLGWGLVFGFGSSIAFFPSVALVGQYFKAKRALANGIILAGGALGAFCMPPLLEFLVQTYGLHGAALVSCALTLHYCITSELLLVVERRTRIRSKLAEQKPQITSADDKKAVHCYSNEVSLDDEIISEKNEVEKQVFKKQTGTKVDESVLADGSDSGAAQIIATNCVSTKSESEVPEKAPANPSSPSTNGSNGEEVQVQNSEIETCPTTDEVFNKKKRSDVSLSSVELVSVKAMADSCHQLDFKADPENGSPTKRRLSTASHHVKFISALKNIAESLDLRVVCNCTFLVNCGSNAIQIALFMGLVTVLPDYGEDEVGVSRMMAAYFVSASAVADLLTRFLSGWIISRFEFDKGVASFIVLLINAAVFAGIALTQNYVVVMICSILAGFCFALGMILYFEILATCQSADKYPMAFGLSEMMKSPLLLLAAATVGTLKDATGSYMVTLFIFCGLGVMATSMWVLQRLWVKKHQ